VQQTSTVTLKSKTHAITLQFRFATITKGGLSQVKSAIVV